MNQIDLFDVCRKRHRGNSESESANAKIHSAKAAIRSRILEYIAAQGIDGATCDEIEQALELAHQTASARCSELKMLKLVHSSDKRRSTRSGGKAAVLVVVK